jgi:hypothetical protein
MDHFLNPNNDSVPNDSVKILRITVAGQLHLLAKRRFSFSGGMQFGIWIFEFVSDFRFSLLIMA